MNLDPDDLARVAWALRYTADEARKQGCPVFAARLDELATTLGETDEERAS